MTRLICRWFGCNAARIAWTSSNTVTSSCSRCGNSATWTRR